MSTFYTDTAGTTVKRLGGTALPFQPPAAKDIRYTDLLGPLDASERRQLALYMRFAAESANRELGDVAALLDINTLATVTEPWLTGDINV